MIAAKLATMGLGGNQHSEGVPIGRAASLLNVGPRSVARTMTKGQRAMAVAKIYPQGNQGKKTLSVSKEVASGAHISNARTVIAFAPELADAVLAGAVSLDEAKDTLSVSFARPNAFAPAQSGGRGNC